MDHWVLPAIAVMLIASGAVSGRLRSTPVSQAMVFVPLGLLAGNQAVQLVDADRWSPTRGSPPASARASTSRAASTTGCASPC